jgi:hypothetical protein
MAVGIRLDALTATLAAMRGFCWLYLQSRAFAQHVEHWPASPHRRLRLSRIRRPLSWTALEIRHVVGSLPPFEIFLARFGRTRLPVFSFLFYLFSFLCFHMASSTLGT